MDADNTRINSLESAVLECARLVREAGGRALLVGGAVRDMIYLASNSVFRSAQKDFDIEVFGLDAPRLESALKKSFAIDTVGISFGVIKLHHYDIDVALARRETKLGLGHKAFGMDFDTSLTLEEAAARRDFTLNAIYLDPLTNELLDPWGGERDLKRGILRHVSGHFGEDPLRVLRAMQFLARFDLRIAPETLAICAKMTAEGLAKERLFAEWEKMLVKGKRISRGLEFLRASGWVNDYPELKRLIGCDQAIEWHPEGDVWNHTLLALDAFAAQRNGEGEAEDLIVGLAVLCHDFGKPLVSYYDRAKHRIRSPGHDTAGLEPTLSFLRRLTNEERILKEVPVLVTSHMRPYAMWKTHAGESAIRRLSAQVGRIDRLVRVCAADDAGRATFDPDFRPLEWLLAEAARLQIKDSKPKPILMGRHLIAKGMKPGVAFGKILSAAYEAQLDGVFFDEQGALKWLEDRSL